MSNRPDRGELTMKEYLSLCNAKLPTPTTDAADNEWVKGGQYSHRERLMLMKLRELERELAAYQNAERPEAPKVLNSLEALGAVHATPLVAKSDYDALAKRCARLTVEKMHACLELGNQIACLEDELEATRKDAKTDSDILDWIEDNCRTTGGGAGMTVTFFTPDSEYVRGGVMAALAAGKEKR